MKVFSLTLRSYLISKVLLTFSFTLFLAFLSQIRIYLSFTPVPVTLQTLGILFIGYYLGKNWGLVSVFFYILFGALGLPFFAGAKGGFLVLSGPTGGYIIGFLLGVYLVGLAKERGLLTKPFSLFILGIGFHLLIYGLGTVWFWAGYYPFKFQSSFKELLTFTVLPFIPLDLVKVFIFSIFVSLEKKFKGQ